MSPTTALFISTEQGFIPCGTGNIPSFGRHVSTPRLIVSERRHNARLKSLIGIGELRNPTPTQMLPSHPEPARGWPADQKSGPVRR